MQLRVQRQHFGQGAVAVDALGQRLPVQGQLALHAVAFACSDRCQAHWLAANMQPAVPASRMSSVQNWRRRGVGMKRG